MILHPSEKRPNASTVTNDFVCAQLTLPEDPIYEGDWNLPDAATQRLGTNHHLHLKHITAGLRHSDDSLQYVFLVQSRSARISVKPPVA